MSKTKWSADKTWKFVIEYRLRECLWNTNLHYYKDRWLKDAAYTELAEMFGLGGMNDVKIKIKNLRTTYIQEYKKIQESMKASSTGKEERVYVPTLVWYKEMDSFLNYTGIGKIIPVNTSVSGTKLGDTDGDIHIKEELVDDVTSENMEITNILGTPESPQNYELTPSKEVILQMPRKRKLQPHNPHTITLDNSNSAPCFEEHEFDIFGKSVAKQLKSFSSIAAALRVQSKIQSLLTEERIQDHIAASDANLRHSSANQRFFYNQGSSDYKWPNSVAAHAESSNLSNESCTSASLTEESKDFEVAFAN